MALGYAITIGECVATINWDLVFTSSFSHREYHGYLCSILAGACLPGIAAGTDFSTFCDEGKVPPVGDGDPPYRAGAARFGKDSEADSQVSFSLPPARLECTRRAIWLTIVEDTVEFKSPQLFTGRCRYPKGVLRCVNSATSTARAGNGI